MCIAANWWLKIFWCQKYIFGLFIYIFFIYFLILDTLCANCSEEFTYIFIMLFFFFFFFRRERKSLKPQPRATAHLYSSLRKKKTVKKRQEKKSKRTARQLMSKQVKLQKSQKKTAHQRSRYVKYMAVVVENIKILWFNVTIMLSWACG